MIKISNEIILFVFITLVVAAALVVLDTWGVASEPTACEVGPMEAAQCRAEGRVPARPMFGRGGDE